MTEPLRDFLRAARGAGLRLSPAESIDAMRAMQVVGWQDRTAVKDALGLVLAKTPAEKQALDQVFERFFAPPGAPPAAPEQAPDVATQPQPGQGFGGGEGGGLAAQIEAGDLAALQAALAEAAAAENLRDIQVFTQVNLFTRRILERMGLREIEARIARGEASAQLREGLDWLRGEARALVERNLALFGAPQLEAWREQRLRDARLGSLDRRDVERMRALVRTLARKLAARHARPRRQRLRGQLDARRTIRRNMPWGGVPFRTVWKQRVIEKPKLLVLADVSGSCAPLAQFLLLFLHELNAALSGLRAFAFAGGCIEVTELLDRLPIEAASAEIMARIGWGSSSYGASMEDFARLALGSIDHRTTVLVLGDARGNRTDPRVDLVQAISERAKQLVWLNPEPPLSWGSGDSDMLRYRPFCRLATQVNTLAQLERVVTDLLEKRA